MYFPDGFKAPDILPKMLQWVELDSCYRVAGKLIFDEIQT